MVSRNERNCQIRMSSALWNLVGEIAQELGYKDARGRHSVVIREMIAAAAAKWAHSPYVCRSDKHTIYVTKDGSVFARQVQVIRLNSPRERLPCFVEMKPEKREYYHRDYLCRKEQGEEVGEESHWFLGQWLVNSFSVWNGKKDADDIESFRQPPLSSCIDTFGTTSKSADLAVHAVGGRFLTREIVIGLVDYVQWKEDGAPIFDRFDIPIDIPTTDLDVCVVVDQELFTSMDIEADGIANLALEFRNRESALFSSKEVALYPEVGINELYGRASQNDGVDEGADEMFSKLRRLRERVSTVLAGQSSEKARTSTRKGATAVGPTLQLPRNFLFYWLRWPTPHLGIEACIRWEKPVKGGK